MKNTIARKGAAVFASALMLGGAATMTAPDAATADLAYSSCGFSWAAPSGVYDMGSPTSWNCMTSRYASRTYGGESFSSSNIIMSRGR